MHHALLSETGLKLIVRDYWFGAWRCWLRGPGLCYFKSDRYENGRIVLHGV